MSTAIAVNSGYSSLAVLSVVDSMEEFDFLDAYLDHYYAPMEPVYCFDIQQFIERAAAEDDMSLSRSRMLTAAQEISALGGTVLFLDLLDICHSS
jgi:hypothetical protein